MDSPPKKKRKLLIIDIGEDGKPIASYTPTKPLEGIGNTHKELQQYVLKLAEHYKFEGEIDGEVWKKVDEVLKATTPEEANAAIKSASEHAVAFFQGATGSSSGR